MTVTINSRSGRRITSRLSINDAISTLGNKGNAVVPPPPALCLDFLSGTLDPRITFSRASSGTYFGSDGLLKVSPVNLLLQSADLSNVAWTYANTTRTTESVTPPITGAVVNKVVVGSGFSTTGNDSVGSFNNNPAGTTAVSYTYSLYVKDAGAGFFRIREKVSTGGRVKVNLTDGSQVGENAWTSGQFTVLVTSVGDGWWRIAVTRTPATTLGFDFKPAIDTGDGVSGIYFTAPQLELGSQATTYIPTTTTVSGAPRFYFDPATGICRGLLIEESRANLLLHSRDMTQAAWSKADVTPTRNQIGLDGVSNTATLMTEGTLLTAFTQQDVAAVTADSTITVSFAVKRGNTDWVRLGAYGGGFTNYTLGWFNLATGAKGTVTNVGAATNGSSTITNLGGGWYRLTVTSSPGGGYTIPKMGVCSANADNSTTRVSGATYIVDCAQLEVGAFSTSPIVTTTTSLTRAADSASMTGANFSSWWNATEGTMVATWDAPSAGASMARATNVVGTAALDIGWSSGRIPQMKVNAAFVNTNAGVQTAGVTIKSAASYNGTDTLITAQGAASVTTANIPSTNTALWLGSFSGSATFLNGHISRIAYFNKRLPDATLRALTQ